MVLKKDYPILSKAKIRHINVIDSSILISTYGFGTFLISNQDTLQFSKNDGLLSDFCEVSYRYKNNLYIGTNKGLNIINLPFISGDKIISSQVGRGVENNNIKDIIFFNDSIYLATFGGVFVFSPNALLSQKINPLFIVEQLSVNNKAVDFNEEHNFSYSQNRFSFKITPITYQFKDRLKIQYSLSTSSESKWVNTKSRFLEFNALSPGNYTFKVRTLIDNYKAEAFSYDFTIAQPFWKQWWFISIIIISIALLIYSFFKIRVLTYNKDVVRELIKLFIEKLKKEDYIIIKNVQDGSHTKIALSQILYLNSSGNYVEIVQVNQNKTLVRTTLKDLHRKLVEYKKHKFVRCHKSYVINANKVSAVHSNFLKVQNKKVPVGKWYLKNISSIKELL